MSMALRRMREVGCEGGEVRCLGISRQLPLTKEDGVKDGEGGMKGEGRWDGLTGEFGSVCLHSGGSGGG